MTQELGSPSPSPQVGSSLGETTTEPATEGGDQPEAGGAGRTGIGATLRELGIVVLIALVLSLLIKTFLVQAFWIPSESMENTLIKDDRVMVSKLTPGPWKLRRGDVVVFKDSGGWLTHKAAKEYPPAVRGLRHGLVFVGLLPSDANDHLIKRVIGLPGDTVECCDAQGRLMVNGKPIDETVYLKPGEQPSGVSFTVTVPEGRLWVMGDNRGHSGDSRAHRDAGRDGTIPLKDVVGKAFLLAWPADRFTRLTNPDEVFHDVPAPQPRP
jgi:signal peptidase I